MDQVPDARLLPIAQASPTVQTGTAVQLLSQHPRSFPSNESVCKAVAQSCEFAGGTAALHESFGSTSSVWTSLLPVFRAKWVTGSRQMTSPALLRASPVLPAGSPASLHP